MAKSNTKYEQSAKLLRRRRGALRPELGVGIIPWILCRKLIIIALATKSLSAYTVEGTT